MPREPFAAFLAASLELLERECPPAHAALRRALADREVQLDVDGEPIALAFGPQGAALDRVARAPRVAVATTRRAILDLIDARASLLDAVLEETLWLRGAPQDLLAFLDGLRAYLHGAVRAPSFPRLLRRFRDAAAD